LLQTCKLFSICQFVKFIVKGFVSFFFIKFSLFSLYDKITLSG